MTLDDFNAYDSGKTLKAGFTTGTCAAAAARAAAELLVSGERPEAVEISLPAGPVLTLMPEEMTLEGRMAMCAIRKHAGDDPDVTDGILIRVTVEAAQLEKEEGPAEILIDGGKGVGRVTRAGLDQPVGAAAINSTPRRMIKENIEEVLKCYGMGGSYKVTVSAEGGEAIAAGTFNPRLGIEGGISILGTSGVVKPMSRKALIDTIRVDMRVHAETGRPVLAVPGNYGLSFLEETYSVPKTDPVLMSNYIGETIDAACEFKAKGLLLAGHLGKFVKLAGGIMNTHSREADARLEILTAHAVRCGAALSLVKEILDTKVTTDAAALLKQHGLLIPVSESLLNAIEQHILHRSGGSIETGVILYTLEDGILAKSENAERLLKESTNGAETALEDNADSRKGENT